MDVYRIIYLILVVEALITGCRTTHIEKKVIYWTGAILLITVTAFRSSTVGEDTQNYCIAFDTRFIMERDANVWVGTRICAF